MLSALEQQDFIDELIPNQADVLLTTVIGIKCRDGVVIGTDSQFTDRVYGTKNLNEIHSWKWLLKLVNIQNNSKKFSRTQCP